jgi:2-C-methyl-D-erythritol 4-phosphate cytidylyltransferase
LVSNDLIERVIADSRLKGATVPGVKITDSIKRVSPTGYVESNIDRENLVAVQTPQGFHFSILKNAYSGADYSASDDSSLVEKFYAVSIIPGDKNNIKITYPEDLAHAEMILKQVNRDIL